MVRMWPATMPARPVRWASVPRRSSAERAEGSRSRSKTGLVMNVRQGRFRARIAFASIKQEAHRRRDHDEPQDRDRQDEHYDGRPQPDSLVVHESSPPAPSLPRFVHCAVHISGVAPQHLAELGPRQASAEPAPTH